MSLSIGLIGAGAIGAEHGRMLSGQIAGARLAAVADVDARRAGDLAAATGAAVFDHAAALVASDEVDAVVVASPAATHADAVLRCVEAAKPVMCEKPLAAAADECAAVVDAEVKARRRLVQVGFMRRFDPAYVELKAAIDDGRIGQPHLMHQVHRNPAAPPGFSNEMMMTEALIHEFDASRWLLDGEVAAVRVLAPGPSVNAPPGVSDPQVVILEMAGGAIADAEMFASCGYGYDVRCEVVGSAGVVALEPPRLSTVTRCGARAVAVPDGWKARFGDTYRRELQAWVDAACDGTVVGPSAWDGYAATLIAVAAIAAHQSADRTPVPLPVRPPLYT